MFDFYFLLFLDVRVLEINFDTRKGVHFHKLHNAQQPISVVKKEEVLRSIQPEWPSALINGIRALDQSNLKTLIVLDNDQTRTQTFHDIEVLTDRMVRILPLFYFMLCKENGLHIFIYF